MKKIIRAAALLLSLTCCFALFSCGEAAPDYKRAYNTDAGILTFDVPLGDRDVSKWEEELKSFAETFEDAYLKLAVNDTGLLGEINTPEINVVLDCDADEVAFLSETYDKCVAAGINPLSEGTVTFEGTTVRLSSGNAALDFSEAALPFAVEETVTAFHEAGYNDGLISIGDFCAVLGLKGGEEAYHIGIPKTLSEKDEESPVSYYGYVSITDGYLAMGEGEGEIEKAVVYCADPTYAIETAKKLPDMTLEAAKEYYGESEILFEAVFITGGKALTTEGLENTSIFTEETTAENTEK